MPSKPEPVTTRPDTEDTPREFRDEARIVAERDRDYAAQRATARPADEVVERLLRRHPAP